jgi:hypothetical protein
VSALVSGRNALSLEVIESSIGAWHCTAEADGDAALSGAVTVDVEGTTWRGYVLRSKGFAGRCQSWIVGGKGQLAKIIDAKHYSNTTAATVAADICRDSGEVLASGLVLTQRLTHWERTQGQASHCLVALCDRLGLTWRTLRDGSIWIGTDAWATVKPKVEVEDEDWAAGCVQLMAEQFSELARLAPGVTFDGSRINEVVFYVNPDEQRAIVRIDSVSSALNDFLSVVRRKIEMAGSYECTVKAQNADGTLQLAPTDTKIAKLGNGLNNVPIRYGMPGYRVTVTAGAMVRLHFDGVDGDKPYAALWDSGHESSVASLEFEPGGASSPACRVGDTIDAALPMGAPVTGLLGGVPFVGVITVTAPVKCVLVGPGNSKLLI